MNFTKFSDEFNGQANDKSLLARLCSLPSFHSLELPVVAFCDHIGEEGKINSNFQSFVKFLSACPKGNDVNAKT